MGEKRNRLIVALSGKKGCGKSTVARFLVQQHGFKRLSYASPGRQILKALGLSDVDFLTENKEDPIDWLSGVREVTLCYLMQTLLTAWGREVAGKVSIEAI
jgi:cytidylate kinase